MEDSLAARVKRVQETLKRESAPWGRIPKLVAVTKYASPEQILPLRELGVTDIGENRVQVLREKLPFLNEKFSIHLIGRLQTNKVKYIIKDVCMIQSVDHLALAQEIDRQAGKANRRMPVLLQVNIGREAQKGGLPPEEALPFARECAKLPGLAVHGLMTVLPKADDPETVRPLFRGMRELFERLQAEAIEGVDCRELSMGMSHDWRVAAQEGATMIRIGTAIFGERKYH